MMKAKDVIETLSDGDVFHFLAHEGFDPIHKGGHIEALTLCHESFDDDKSHKLWYYSNSKNFICYTHCGSIGNIFQLMMHIHGFTFREAFVYVCNYFHLDSSFEKVEHGDRIDTSFFNSFKHENTLPSLKKVDEKNLYNYMSIYHDSWINDGITVETMKEYGVRFDLEKNRIIIPHRDHKKRLVGIRCRNLTQEFVDKGYKYMPLYGFEHPTGSNIYGLDVSLPHIKKYKTLVLFEAEKSCMQLNSFDRDTNFSGCISGSNLTDQHVRIILELIKLYGIEEIIIALDKEFENEEEEEFYREKVRATVVDKLLPYVQVSVIWDSWNKLDYKDSPTDKGQEVWSFLLNNRILIE